MPPFSDLDHFWYWLAGGIVLMIAEFFAPGVILLWLGIAAAATGIVLIFLPNLVIELQGTIFAVLAVVSIIVGRLVYRNRKATTDHPTLNRRTEQYVGQVFTLTADPIDRRASVKVGDSVWNVMLQGTVDARAGAHVKVVGSDGALLLVEPVSQA
jgi:membrane protein implicated in regulation of membrane protease activity